MNVVEISGGSDSSTIDRVIEIIVTMGKLQGLSPDQDIYEAGFTSYQALELRMELEDAFNVMIPDDGRFPAARSARALSQVIQGLQ